MIAEPKAGVMSLVAAPARNVGAGGAAARSAVLMKQATMPSRYLLTMGPPKSSSAKMNSDARGGPPTSDTSLLGRVMFDERSRAANEMDRHHEPTCK